MAEFIVFWLVWFSMWFTLALAWGVIMWIWDR